MSQVKTLSRGVMLFTLLFTIILSGSISESAAYERSVLVEDFTNTSCGPCYTWTPYVLRALEDFEDGVDYVLVAYHTWWPGRYDPWWLQNEDENRQKVEHYGVNGVPAFFVDGTSVQLGGGLEIQTRNRINAHLAEETPIDIRLVPRILENGDLRTRVYVSSEENLGDLVLHVFVGEHMVEYQAPNRQNEHHGPMLDMIGENGGDGTDFDIESGETVEFEFESDFSFNVGGREPEEDNIIVAAWVQDSDNIVLQTTAAPFEVTTPMFVISEITVIDNVDGNGDGRAEAGETVDVVITFENDPDFLPAEDIEIVMSTDREGIEILDDTYNLGDLENGQMENNEDSPFSFRVDDGMMTRSATFTFTISAQPGNYSEELPVKLIIGWPDMLVVDGSGEEEAELPMLEVFDTDEIPYVEMWNRSELGDLVEEAIDDHVTTILWHSHNAEENIMTEEEESVLTSFLDNHGILIISGSYMLQTIGERPLFSDYLNVEMNEPSVSRAVYVIGEEGDDHFDGMRGYLGRGPAGSSSRKPALNLLGSAEAVTRYENNMEKIGAAKNETDVYSTLFFAYSMNTIAGVFDTETFSEFMTRIISWKNDRELATPHREAFSVTEFELEAAFPNPFNSQTVIPFSLSTAGDVTLDIFDLNGRLISTLHEGALPAGKHSAQLNANDYDLSSGVYYLRLESNNLHETQKLVYLR